MTAETKNARISSTMLGIEDHGILTAFLYLDYGGAGQGFGGYAFDGAADNGNRRVGSRFGTEFVRAVLETVGVGNWEDLPGKHIRVQATHDRVDAIGHIIKDKWFSPRELLERIRLEPTTE